MGDALSTLLPLIPPRPYLPPAFLQLLSLSSFCPIQPQTPTQVQTPPMLLWGCCWTHRLAGS